MRLIAALAAVLVILVITEILWHRRLVHGEVARKMVHISVGSFVAFWPYFLGWPQIQLASLAFLIVVTISRRHKLFRAVHGVSRKTRGEIFFPIGIGIAALLEPPSIIFMAAILHLSLADGLAAIIGTRFGMIRQYKIRSYVKTVLGSLTFCLVSSLIILSVVVFARGQLGWALWPLIVWLPLMATLVENLAVGGLDNVFVPILVIAVLQLAELH